MLEGKIKRQQMTIYSWSSINQSLIASPFQNSLKFEDTIGQFCVCLLTSVGHRYSGVFGLTLQIQ